MKLSYGVVWTLSSIESGLREKLKIESTEIKHRYDLMEFIALSDDETFTHVVNFCRFYPEYIINESSYPLESSYIAFYLTHYAPVLREYIKTSGKLWSTAIDVLRLIDSGKTFPEAVRSVEIDRELVEFLKRFGPIYIYESGVVKHLLLLPSPAELKEHGVDDHMVAEQVVEFLLSTAEIKEDHIKLQSGHVYKPSNPFELYTRLLQARNVTLKDNALKILRSMVVGALSQFMKCEENSCRDDVEKVCTNIGIACDVSGTIRVDVSLEEGTKLKVDVTLSNNYLEMKGSTVAQNAVDLPTLLNAVKRVVTTLISHADTINTWMKSVSASSGVFKGINVGNNLRIEIAFENSNIQEGGLMMSVPHKATIRFDILTKYVPDRLLKEALSKFDVKTDVHRDRRNLNVSTIVSGRIETPVEGIVSAFNRVLEVRDAVVGARQRYKEHVVKKRPFRSVDEAVAAYLNFVSSPLFDIAKRSSLAVEPGTVLTNMQALLIQSGKHTAKTILDIYKDYEINPLIASPQAIVAALIKDGVLDVSDHVYVRGRDIEDLLRRFTDNPTEAEARIREYVLVDVLIYAAEKKDYEVITRLNPYITGSHLEKIARYITPLIAIRLLDGGVTDESARGLLIRKVLAEGTPRQKTYVVYKYLRNALRGVPNISLTKVDDEYVIDVGAFYVQIDSISRESITIIAYRKDTKVGFRFSGATFKEALRHTTQKYDVYLDKVQTKHSDELIVLESPEEKSAEESAELTSA